MVRAAVKASRSSESPVAAKLWVGEVFAFGCLDVDKGDVVPSYSLPVDFPLVVRNINSVAFTLMQWLADSGEYEVPADGEESREKDESQEPAADEQ